MQPPISSLLTIGWREWAQLPDLGLTAIKFKTDTGARTSALHAVDIHHFTTKGEEWVRFNTQPIQGNTQLAIACEARVVDIRTITNSGGQQETRPVIETSLMVGKQSWQIKLTLTNRAKMKFRMLLGRRAMLHHCCVDPSRSYLNGRLKAKDNTALKSQSNTS